jgi:hypothetical protein
MALLTTTLFALLGRPQAVQLRTWEISGQIDSFQKDLLIRQPVTAKKEEAQGAVTPCQAFLISLPRVETLPQLG